MKLFSGSASQNLTKKIGEHLHIPLSPVDTHIFPDAERRVRIPVPVLNEKAVVIQSTTTPVDEHYMELFFIVDGLKRSGAEFVTAVMPYFGYQRQDHVFRDGEAVSLQVIIKILESVGVDRLISVDLHTPRIPDLFTIPVVHLSALPIFAGEIKEITRQLVNPLTNSEAILVSPDMGGISRIKKVSEIVGNMPFIALEKNRDLESGTLSGDLVKEGIYKDQKIAFIVDDMIASGKTIALAADVLKKMGVEKIFVFATHGVFSEEAPKILQESHVEKVYVTDSVAIRHNKQFPKLEILSIAGIIANALASSF